MAARAGFWSLVVLAAFVLGVGGASGRAQQTTNAIRVEVVGVGSVTDSAGVISCGNGATACRSAYVPGTSVTFTETPPATGAWTFDGWDGDCPGSTGTCTITVGSQDGDYEVVADFVPAGGQVTQSTLTVTNTGDGQGNGGNVSAGSETEVGIDCDTSDNGTDNCQWDAADGLYQGSTITLVETPDDGFVFGGWGGACTGTSVSCTLTIGSSDVSVHATFKEPQLTVTIVGNGTVTGTGIVCTSPGDAVGCTSPENAGDVVTLTATGSFTGWSGACSGKDTTCTVTMSTDRNVTATFAGGGSTPTTFPLSVTVDGDGQVTGGGLSCGGGATACSANVSSGTSVTLTATPSDGATFTSWGGACSGSSATCSLTMSAAKTVTATFSGGSTATVDLSVVATGHGTVTGGGISCGNGKTACSAKVKQGSTVGLTATPGPGGSFGAWGGACSGKTPTCTLSMDSAKSVSATFRGGSSVSSAALRSTGKPLVRRSAGEFQVTLRFHTSSRGRVKIEALRAGRVETKLAFTAAAGNAIVGPFPVSQPGFYVFQLQLGPRTLRWTACLGRCGEGAATSPFTLTRELPSVVDAGALWAVTLHFRSTQPAGIDVRVYRGLRLAREVRFPAPAGRVTPDAILLSPGTYRIRLIGTDAVGRVRALAWYALLPSDV